MSEQFKDAYVAEGYNEIWCVEVNHGEGWGVFGTDTLYERKDAVALMEYLQHEESHRGCIFRVKKYRAVEDSEALRVREIP